MPSSSGDRFLKNALVKAYAARASLFHRGVHNARMRDLFHLIDSLHPDVLEWDFIELEIAPQAFELISRQGIEPHKVFAHPSVLIANPGLVRYYRNLVAVSQKGMSQLGYPTGRYERQNPAAMRDDVAAGLARMLNSIISRVVEGLEQFDLSSTRDVAFAEIGTELQGTWANKVGKGATKAVEDIFGRFIEQESRGTREQNGVFHLTNGWRIIFGSEPDVRFLDADGTERIVVEIKGSLDKAGAQTRYGEAKKSFGKALARNPRCYTVYLASCFTEAVVRQIEMDGQVRDTFNLTSILYDSEEQERFLRRIFHIVDTPQ